MSSSEPSELDPRVFPEAIPRVESGPVQFGEDWPGLFLRGDYAGPVGVTLLSALEMIEAGDTPDPISMLQLKVFALRLQSCKITSNKESLRVLMSD